MAIFDEYAATAGYSVCAEEIHAPLDEAGIEAVATLGSAFEAWVERLQPAPLEVMLGIDVDLEPTAAGGH